MGIDIIAGTIDPGYKGIVFVVVFNHSDEPFEIKRGKDLSRFNPFKLRLCHFPGDRIAQLVVQPFVNCECVEVDNLQNKGNRNEAGFGSTGIKSKEEPLTQSATQAEDA